MIGRTLAHYRILEKLGEGGMGTVYLAEDTKLERKVALKVLPAEMAASPERLERFEREAKSVAALNHPNIVTIHAVEEAEGTHFFAMEYVEGQTIDARIPAGGLTLEKFFDLAIPLADALRAAHEQGIIHRDLKPANVMLDREGRAKILDFGLARLRLPHSTPDVTQLPTAALTQEGLVLGTVPYMSPEQVEGRQVDARSDIFSLGVLFYEMLSGHRPFQGESSAALVSCILRDTPAEISDLREDLPADLGRILRRCLEKDPERRFQTAKDVRNELETLKTEWASGLTPVRPRRAPPPVSPIRRWTWLAVPIGLAVVLVVAGLWWSRLRSSPLAAEPSIASLAVLPLENLSGDPEHDYFADGFTEALITDLAALSGLEKVIARSSVMRLKGTEKLVPEIARELGVEAVVTGSVLREGDRVQVTAQLLDASSEELLWSDRFQREMTGILSLQNEIVGEIVNRVEIQLSPREATTLARRETVDPDAYAAVLRGNHYRSIWDPRALAEYRQAVDQDPLYVPAYLGLAEAYRVMGLYGQIPARKAHRLAWAALVKALELEPENAKAHVMRGVLAFQFGWDPEEAEKAFETARRLDPESLTGHLLYAWVLVVAGRFDEGIAVVQDAIERDPLNTDPVQQLNWSYFTARRYQEALEALERLSVMTGFSGPVGELELAGMGRTAEAIKLAEQNLDDDLGQFALMKKIWIFSKGGERERVRELLERLKRLGESGWVDPLFLALGHAAAEEFDEALIQIERGLEARSVNMMFLKTTPPLALADVLDPLRSDPRFQQLLERIRPLPLDALAPAAPAPTS